MSAEFERGRGGERSLPDGAVAPGGDTESRRADNGNALEINAEASAEAGMRIYMQVGKSTPCMDCRFFTPLAHSLTTDQIYKGPTGATSQESLNQRVS